MGSPEIDTDGFPIPYDDEDIKDSHTLARYICPVRDVHPEENRIISSAFSTSSKSVGGENPGMSSDWEESIIKADETVEERATTEDHGIAKLNVGQVRAIGNGIKVGQTPNDDNPHHTDVWGVKNKQRKLYKMADIVRNPSSIKS